MMSIKLELGFYENHYLHMDMSTVRSHVEWYLPTLQENAINKKIMNLNLCRKIWGKNPGHNINLKKTSSRI